MTPRHLSTIASVATMTLAACSPSAPQAADPRRLPVPIRGAEDMTLIRGPALERLIRGGVQTRPTAGSATGATEHFAAVGDGYTIGFARPDSAGRYRITPDRVCLRFPADRSIYCRFYLTDASGATWMAEDDRDYPLHSVRVAIGR